MKTNEGNILNVLDGKLQFILPTFQRHYSWDIENCNQLWRDILDIQRNNRSGHFIGAIVNIADDATPTGVTKYTLIDGQQRLATLTLILTALRDYSLSNPANTNINAAEIENTRLVNQYAKDEEYYKIILTGDDKKILLDLIDRVHVSENIQSRLVKNYKFFMEKVSQRELSPAEIYEAIGKLKIVNITLDSTDNAQAIFESLNSTGKNLSESDLIRNFVLMGLDREQQDEVYKKFWFPMEKLFGNNAPEKIMDNFFRDYLTMKLHRIPNEKRVYDEFKAWYYRDVKDKITIQDICKDIYEKAIFYTDIIFAKNSDPTRQALYKEIKDLKMEVSYPFLLKVHEDFQNGLITGDDLREILRLCISFVVRRYICGIATNGMNKTFATLRNEIDTANYMNSLKAKWGAMRSQREFPDDKKFQNAFMFSDIYKLSARRFYILMKLENFDNKEKILNIASTKDFSIEHVMPQNENLSPEWQQELGENWREIQQKYLHTIGNLTLTAYNSELGDHSFTEKLTMTGGYLESGLRLNSFIREQNNWNERIIRKRARLLADKALKIWQYPKVEGSVAEKIPGEEKVTYSLDYYGPGEQARILFEALDRRIKSLSDDIECAFNKLYVAYKINETNFADVVILKQKLKIYVNMNFSDVIDPKEICRDVSNIGHWGIGDIEVFLENLSQLDDVMEIIMQAFDEKNEE